MKAIELNEKRTRFMTILIMNRASNIVQNSRESKISKISKKVFIKIAKTANINSKFTGPANSLFIWKK